MRLVALFLDAVFLHVRPDGPKEGVLVAWGFTEDGERILLSVTLGMRESFEDWQELGRDLIARGLSPFAPQNAAIEAGRIMLREIARHVEKGESFAFETTLAGRAYAHHIRRWRRAFGNRGRLQHRVRPLSRAQPVDEPRRLPQRDADENRA